jgi:hypothetical protein
MADTSSANGTSAETRYGLITAVSYRQLSKYRPALRILLLGYYETCAGTFHETRIFEIVLLSLSTVSRWDQFDYQVPLTAPGCPNSAGCFGFIEVFAANSEMFKSSVGNNARS